MKQIFREEEPLRDLLQCLPALARPDTLQVLAAVLLRLAETSCACRCAAARTAPTALTHALPAGVRSTLRREAVWRPLVADLHAWPDSHALCADLFPLAWLLYGHHAQTAAAAAAAMAATEDEDAEGGGGGGGSQLSDAAWQPRAGAGAEGGVAADATKDGEGLRLAVGTQGDARRPAARRFDSLSELSPTARTLDDADWTLSGSPGGAAQASPLAGVQEEEEAGDTGSMHSGAPLSADRCTYAQGFCALLLLLRWEVGEAISTRPVTRRRRRPETRARGGRPHVGACSPSERASIVALVCRALRACVPRQEDAFWQAGVGAEWPGMRHCHEGERRRCGRWRPPSPRSSHCPVPCRHARCRRAGGFLRRLHAAAHLPPHRGVCAAQASLGRSGGRH